MIPVTMTASSRAVDENVIAQRLLDARLHEQSVDIRQLEGRILALHLTKIDIFIRHALPGPMRTPSEEVLQSTMEKATRALRRGSNLRWVAEESERSFAGLFYCIAAAEVIDFRRGRPGYRDDQMSYSSQLDSFEAHPLKLEDLAEAEPVVISAEKPDRHDAALILEAAGGLDDMSAVLLVLKHGLSLSYGEIEALLEIQASHDPDRFTSEATKLLGSHRDFAAKIMALLRKCDATPKTHGALKVQVHRAATRVRAKIDPDDLLFFHVD